MDVLRRAVGDKKLSYLGFSYARCSARSTPTSSPTASARWRSTVSSTRQAWVGTHVRRTWPQTDRLRSADGAWKALREILVRCDKGGRHAVPLRGRQPGGQLRPRRPAAQGKAARLRGAWGTERFTYADLVGSTLSMLYSPRRLAEHHQHDGGPHHPHRAAARTAAAAKRRAAAKASFVKVIAKEREKRRSARYDFPYDNSFEAFATVLCTDGLNPPEAAAWPAYAAAADRRAKYFGSAWTWASVQCASRTWTVRDEDAYRGPFNRRTIAPVLVVGNYWDPATNYSGAVAAARLLPNSRLLSSDSWGHTALGTSSCVDEAISAYLLAVRLPARRARCSRGEHRSKRARGFGCVRSAAAAARRARSRRGAAVGRSSR
jgi:hypothetical protein